MSSISSSSELPAASGLAPGPWQVIVRDEEIGPHSTSYDSFDGEEPLEWSCTVEVGRTTRFDLDLSGR